MSQVNMSKVLFKFSVKIISISVNIISKMVLIVHDFIAYKYSNID